MTGDWSPFWAARDYLDDVDRIRASVFVVHGLNDWNVKTKAFAEWWYRLAQRGVPRKIWLHNGGHGGPGGPGAAAVHGCPRTAGSTTGCSACRTGSCSEPRATIQREDGSYSDEADWPAPGRARRRRCGCRRATRRAPGELSAEPAGRGGEAQSFVDRGRELDTDDVLIQGPDDGAPRPARLPHALAAHATSASAARPR